MYFSPLPLDKVHTHRRKAEAEWNKRNYKSALLCFESAIADLRAVLRLDEVRKDAAVLRTLECQLSDLQRQARHCGVYVARSDRQQPAWEDGGGRAAVSDASVRLETVRRLDNYDFSCDTLLSGLSSGGAIPRNSKPVHAGARKRPKAPAELLEELRVMVAAKRLDLQHHLLELRRARAKVAHSRSERDYFRDRVRIREESYDLTPPSSSPASHRLRHLAAPRREKEEEEEKALPPTVEPLSGVREPENSFYDLDPSVCTIIEGRLGAAPIEGSTLSTLSWAGATGPDSMEAELASERATLGEVLTQLQADLTEVTRQRAECEEEAIELDAEVSHLRQQLNEAAPPPIEVTNSDSDSENCALLPLSLPPAFNFPQNLMPSGSFFLEE